MYCRPGLVLSLNQCFGYLFLISSSLISSLSSLANIVFNRIISIVRYFAIQRSVRDSNSRYPFGYGGFQNRCLQPLGQHSNKSRVCDLNAKLRIMSPLRYQFLQPAMFNDNTIQHMMFSTPSLQTFERRVVRPLFTVISHAL